MSEELEPHVKEAMERLSRLEAEKDAEMQVNLEGIMLRMTKNFKPVTQAEVEDWEWKHCVVEGMKELGWDERSCRRIAPNWNCPKQEQAFRAMDSRLTGIGSIVALVGERGVGKTTLAAEHSRLRLEAQRAYFQAPANERALPHPPREPGRYEKLGRISNIFKPLYADFGSINTEELSKQLEIWCRRELVVIDELHETEDLKTNMRFLVDFVDRRYANKKDTILISNHSAEEFAASVNSSIISRISHHGGIIRCNWESHRK